MGLTGDTVRSAHLFLGCLATAPRFRIRPGGILVGIPVAVAILIVALILALCCFCCSRRRAKKETDSQQDQQVEEAQPIAAQPSLYGMYWEHCGNCRDNH